MDGAFREMNSRVLGRGVGRINSDGRELKLNNVLFMDDLKLVIDSEDRLRQPLEEFYRKHKKKIIESKNKVFDYTRTADNRRMNVAPKAKVMTSWSV